MKNRDSQKSEDFTNILTEMLKDDQNAFEPSSLQNIPEEESELIIPENLIGSSSSEAQLSQISDIFSDLPQLSQSDGNSAEQTEKISKNETEKYKSEKSKTSKTSDKVALHYMAHKAGMNDVDKAKIQKIILEASKDSDYYKREQLRSQQATERSFQMLRKIEEYKNHNGGRMYQKAKKEAQNLIQNLEITRITNRTWIHVDMDMFYAAVEIRDKPELANIPVAIGSESMISTANYEARKYGVRSAMPGFIGKKLCPQLVFVPCNYQKYREASHIFKEIVENYDPEFESMGLDETNLDVTQYLLENELTTPEQIQSLAQEIRQKVFEATKLTCSAGIGPNKMIAKICSDINKPNGQTFVSQNVLEVKKFMADLEVRKIPGIGRMTELTLEGIGVKKCSDVLEKAAEIMISYKDQTATFLIQSALGVSRAFHEYDGDDTGVQKSISTSETFKPLKQYEQFKTKINELCEDLAKRMDNKQVGGTSLTIVWKTTKFDVQSKALMLNSYVWSKEELFKFGIQILDQAWPIEPVRLLGIRMSNLRQISEIKKDKSLSDFFNTKLSKNEREQQIKKNNEKAKIQISQISREVSPKKLKTGKSTKITKVKSKSLTEMFNNQPAPPKDKNLLSSKRTLMQLQNQIGDKKETKQNKKSKMSVVSESAKSNQSRLNAFFNPGRK